MSDAPTFRPGVTPPTPIAHPRMVQSHRPRDPSLPRAKRLREPPELDRAPDAVKHAYQRAAQLADAARQRVQALERLLGEREAATADDDAADAAAAAEAKPLPAKRTNEVKIDQRIAEARREAHAHVDAAHDAEARYLQTLREHAASWLSDLDADAAQARGELRDLAVQADALLARHAQAVGARAWVERAVRGRPRHGTPTAPVEPATVVTVIGSQPVDPAALLDALARWATPTPGTGPDDAPDPDPPPAAA